MRIRIDSESNGYVSAPRLIHELLGDIARDASFGGWQETISWIEGSFNLQPNFGRWQYGGYTCTPVCEEDGEQRTLKIFITDICGRQVMRIDVRQYAASVDVEPDGFMGARVFSFLQTIGASVHFGAAA